MAKTVEELEAELEKLTAEVLYLRGIIWEAKAVLVRSVSSTYLHDESKR